MTKADLQANPPLSPEQLPPPIIEPVRDATIIPVGEDAGRSCGVFRADGSFCELSRTRISSDRFTAQPDLPDLTKAERLDGSYLFGGIGRHHFGHFLMESTARLWAMEGRLERFDGLIMLPFAQTDFGSVLRRRLMAFFQIMGVDMPLHLVRTPIIAREVMVPAQGFGHAQWSTGTEHFRNYIRQRIASHCTPQGPKKIYISRSRLKNAYQMVDQEDHIEDMMRAAGYTVFHPQRHSIVAQARVYRAADLIVGGDGSAFHMVPFAMRRKVRIGLIQRRHREDAVNAIINQINTFEDVNLVRLSALEDNSGSNAEPAPINLAALKDQLAQEGFI